MSRSIQLLMVAVLLSGGLSVKAQTSRPFYMSNSVAQAVPLGSPAYQNFVGTLTPAALAQDSDLTSIFVEYLGVPFDVFATTSNPPASNPWVVQMKALADNAKAANKQILLQAVLIRDVPVPKATIENGAVKIDVGWAPRCMDLTAPQYASLKTAYANYVRWLTQTFSPRYFVIMIELNLYYQLCGGDSPSWRKLLEIERTAYLSAKLANGSTIAFPSYKLEDLYGQTLTGYDQVQITALSGVLKDRLGLATYPYGMRIGEQFINVYQLPADYLTRLRDRNPAEPRVLITETGWNSQSIGLSYEGSCIVDYLPSSPAQQSAFLNFLIFSGYLGNFEAISWWSNRDLIEARAMNTCYPQATSPEYTACGGDIWCKAIAAQRSFPRPGTTPHFAELVYKAFGAMGLRQYDGTPTPLLATWQRFLSLPRQ